MPLNLRLYLNLLRVERENRTIWKSVRVCMCLFSVAVTGPPARGQHVKKVMASMCEALGDDSGTAEEKWQLMSSTEGREQTVMFCALFIILCRAVFSAAAEHPEHHAETQCIRMLSVVGGYQQHLIKGGFSGDSGFVVIVVECRASYKFSLICPQLMKEDLFVFARLFLPSTSPQHEMRIIF